MDILKALLTSEDLQGSCLLLRIYISNGFSGVHQRSLAVIIAES